MTGIRACSPSLPWKAPYLPILPVLQIYGDDAEIHGQSVSSPRQNSFRQLGVAEGVEESYKVRREGTFTALVG